MYKCGSWHGKFVFDREMMAVHNGLLREVLGTETLVEPLKRTLNAAVEVDIHKFPGVGKFRSWCKEANQGRGMRHFYSYGMVISAIEEEVEAESEPIFVVKSVKAEHEFWLGDYSKQKSSLAVFTYFYRRFVSRYRSRVLSLRTAACKVLFVPEMECEKFTKARQHWSTISGAKEINETLRSYFTPGGPWACSLVIGSRTNTGYLIPCVEEVPFSALTSRGVQVIRRDQRDEYYSLLHNGGQWVQRKNLVASIMSKNIGKVFISLHALERFREHLSSKQLNTWESLLTLLGETLKEGITELERTYFGSQNSQKYSVSARYYYSDAVKWIFVVVENQGRSVMVTCYPKDVEQNHHKKQTSFKIKSQCLNYHS